MMKLEIERARRAGSAMEMITAAVGDLIADDTARGRVVVLR